MTIVSWLLSTCVAVLSAPACAPSPRPQRRLGNWLASFAALTDLRSRRNFPDDPAGNRCPLRLPGSRVVPVSTTHERNHNMNTVTITGNLTREPEIRYTREGQATAQLGIAVNRRWQDRTTQEWQETTSFFDIVCWRDLAENVALSLTKGMRVVVTGRLEQRSWETDEGEHRSKVEITADEIGPSLRFATADVQRTQRQSGEAETHEVTSF